MTALTSSQSMFRAVIAIALIFSSSASVAQSTDVPQDSLLTSATNDMLMNATVLSQKIISAEQRSWALNNIAIKLSMSHRAAQAKATWSEALSETNRLTKPIVKSATIRELINGALNLGLSDTARHLAFRLDVETDKIFALHSVANAFLESGKKEQAEGMVDALWIMQEELENTTAKASAFARLALLLLKIGDKKQAETALNIALTTAATTIKEPSERTTLLGNFAIDFFSAKQSSSARKILTETLRALSQIKEQSVQSSQKAMLVSSLVQHGEIDAAKSLALSIADRLERATATSRIASELAKLKKVAASKQLFAESHRACTSLRIVADRAEALGREVIELARAGFMDDARAIANEAILFADNIKTPFDKSRTSRDLAIDFAEAGLLDKAETAMTRVTVSSQKIDALCALAIALLQSKAVEKATPFFTDALAKIDSIDVVENRVRNLYGLANAGFQARLSPLADSAFSRAMLAVPLVSEQKKQLELMQTAAMSFAQIRRIDKALETIEKINDAFTQVWTLSEIAEIQRAQNLALGDAEKIVLKRLIDFPR